MPPHTGHAYLIRFAQHFARDVTVFVCTLASEPIPGELRFAWMSELFPDAHLVHITEEIPQASRSSAGAHTIWARAIRERLDHDPRYVFASEGYGADLAQALGAEFVPVDPQRAVFPISAGMIRSDPLGHWEFIPPVVRPYFARTIAVADADGTLARELAERYDTVFATDYPAYVRTLAKEAGSDEAPYVAAPEALARAQASSESALLRQTNRFLFSPTDPLRVLSEAGLPPEERPEALARLLTDYPSVAPSLIVATREVGLEYREAVERQGWELVECTGRDAAMAEVKRRIDRWLTQS